MAKQQFDFHAMESKWKDYWEKHQIYASELSGKQTYTIDTPPPTVSGDMHIGHAYSYSQQDFIARFHRMRHGVFYPFGTDDNGLPTERLVEKLQHVKSKDMTRAEFIKLCLATLKEITPAFVDQWRRLGISADYSTIYSTIDDRSRKISQEKFLELFAGGEVYKASFPTIWCPECQTPIAQAELEDKEKPSKFTTLKFVLAETEEVLPIATTRPELLQACVAVFVHPSDKRYKTYVGKYVRVPLFEQEVPIFADESADPEKGSGVLMICSYGDKFDVDAIARHKLEPRIVFTPEGTTSEGPYAGKSIVASRGAILKDLAEKDLILDQKDISHVVNVHDKCGTPIEFLPTEQWFIKILDKKKKLIAQGKKIRWHPEHMFKRYENWIAGLEWDWSISRERHFGIPIPIWTCQDCGEDIVPKSSELPVDPLQTKKTCTKCKSKNVIGESKVLDTWATSSLSPYLAASLIDNKVNIPFSLRPQGHDIIRTWAFYTIVRGLLHEDKLPWSDIAISGNVSLRGEKMSKSKGNVVEPKTVIAEYGADATRFWAAGTKLGGDLDYQEKDLVTGKKLVNKLLNSSRFTFMNIPENYRLTKPKKLEAVDALFLSELDKLVVSCTNSFETYEYSQAKLAAEKFFWSDFCDNYLEIVKWRVYNGTDEEKASAFFTLYSSLLTLLKLFAPFTPFITEEIYHEHFRVRGEKEKSIHLMRWPTAEKQKDSAAWQTLKDVLGKVRSEKTKAQKSMKAEIELTLDKKDFVTLKDVHADLQHVSGAATLDKGNFKVDFIEA